MKLANITPEQRQAGARSPAARLGTAAVEFAVVAPFLGLLFVVTIDFSRIFYYQITLNQCARNGALHGCALNSYQESGWVTPYTLLSPPTDDDIKAAAIADGANLSPPLQTSNVTVTHNLGTDGNPGVQVSISYTFSTITNFPGLGTAFNLRAKSSMRLAP